VRHGPPRGSPGARRNVGRRAVLLLMACFGLAAAAGAGARLRLYRVEGDSMAPAIAPGDYVLVRRGIRASNGDVVMLRLEGGDAYRIKRVVGVAGDTLAMRGGVLYRGGAPAPEPYLRRPPDLSRTAPPGNWHYAYLVAGARSPRYRPRGADWGPIVVPQRAVFVLGDNRAHSGDSRRFGFVCADEVLGRVVLRR
jgi:signal peptidase I